MLYEVITGDAGVEVGDGLGKGGPAGRVRRGGELAGQVEAGEAQGLERANRLEVRRRADPALRPFLFELVEPLLYACVCVDQSYNFV